jgi:hypothetical protein
MLLDQQSDGRESCWTAAAWWSIYWQCNNSWTIFSSYIYTRIDIASQPTKCCPLYNIWNVVSLNLKCTIYHDIYGRGERLSRLLSACTRTRDLSRILYIPTSSTAAIAALHIYETINVIHSTRYTMYKVSPVSFIIYITRRKGNHAMFVFFSLCLQRFPFNCYTDAAMCSLKYYIIDLNVYNILTVDHAICGSLISLSKLTLYYNTRKSRKTLKE